MDDATMTDLELTKRCAEAMGIGVEESHGVLAAYAKHDQHLVMEVYDPLHDDAQVMALVKKFELAVAWSWAHRISVQPKPEDDEPIKHHCTHTDLNRAIVECVSRMQKAK